MEMQVANRPSRAKRASGALPQLPLLGGRLLIAGGFLAAIGALVVRYTSEFAERYAARFETVLDRSADQNRWQPNKSEEVGITLISADYDKLACAYDKVVGVAHCQYKTESELWPLDPGAPIDDNKKNTIQPFSLVPDNQLILLAGLWAQPAVALRVHQEPDSIPQKKQSRFIAKCRINPVERVQNVSIRWNTTSPWGKAAVVVPNQPDAPPWVAVAEQCVVADE